MSLIFFTQVLGSLIRTTRYIFYYEVLGSRKISVSAPARMHGPAPVCTGPRLGQSVNLSGPKREQTKHRTGTKLADCLARGL